MPPRVVSLIASSTEIVCALGCADWLVGRSHECDYPSSVLDLPVCTEPKFVPDGTSYQIDQKVKAILQEGLSVYRVHADKLKELRPDVIVTQAHCEVCAVSLKDVEQAVCTWVESRPRIVSLMPDAMADVWKDIRLVAGALDVSQRGEELVQRLQTRLAAIAERARDVSPKPRVACIEWIDPLMSAGNWIPELVELSGGVHLFGEAGKHSPHLAWEDLQGADPDVILIMPCGFDIARTRLDVPLLTRLPGWRELRAVRAGRVYLADGNQFFNRPGPRLVESLEILAELLHPEAFPQRHAGTGWQPL